MRKMKAILLTASVSAAVHGALAVLFVPAMAIFFLVHRSVGVHQPDAAITDKIMVIAIVAPVGWALVGFVLGGLMAFLHSLFTAEATTKVTLIVEPPPKRFAAGGKAT